MTIPKIIHHVYPGNDPFKEKYHEFRKSWMAHNLDWTFLFWRIDNFPSQANPEILSAIKDLNYSITPKSDFMRFEVVRLFGGIYVDTDMECLKSFDDFLNHDFFSGYQDDGGTVCPSLFGAIPNHPILENMANISIENAKRCGYGMTNAEPQNVTSVIPFTKLLARYTDDQNVVVYDKHYFYNIGYWERHRLNEHHSDAYAKHYWTGKDPDGWTNTTTFVN